MDVAAGGQVRGLVQNIEREALIGILRLDRSIGDLFDDDGGGVALVARGHGHFVTQHELGKAQRTFEITDVDQPDHEIGRSSGRERVCQEVLISVVAVSLKKKYK